MNLFIFILIIAMVILFGSRGISNPYVALSMLIVSCILGILGIALGIKNIRRAGKV